ncbi:MAG: sensor histidine kinase [Deltaproteobacteria bacterium]|nr:sensor histidine kinase [Deltaproteobacteria bacterium]
MSYSPWTVLAAIVLYMGLLFLVAIFAERRAKAGNNPSNNALIYTLSLAVYCSAWTYYGSVGKAATSGMFFLAIYLGPTMGMFFWWVVLRRLVRIKSVHHLTSIADLISLRYGKSQAVGALVTIIVLAGITPYLALQLKAIVLTMKILTIYQVDSVLYRYYGQHGSWLYAHMGGLIAGLMIIFTIVFGVRRLDPTERHQGMVMAVAAESIVKLLALFMVGIFVTYYLYDGFGQIFTIFSKLAKSPQLGSPMVTGQGSGSSSYLIWMSYLVLSMSAVVFLPRQFHVAVVENFNERHIATASWLFPVYMLLINLFVVPIAMAGLLWGYPLKEADTFVLRLSLDQGHAFPWLPLLVFLGGFSAATAMVMVSTMTIATMVTNHLLLPILQFIKRLGFLRKHLLQCRWAVVAFIIMLAYWFQWEVAWAEILVDMGIISFAAIFQLAPAILGGLFWRHGNRAGALMGLAAGSLVWGYTMLVPVAVKARWLSKSILEQGPWGWGFLAPEHLFGVTILDPLSNTVFWSLFFNLGFYLLGSFICQQNESEQRLVQELVGDDRLRYSLPEEEEGEPTIDLKQKLAGFEHVLSDYMEPARARGLINVCLRQLTLEDKDFIAVTKLAELYELLENQLAGSIGAASAASALRRIPLFTPEEAQALAAVYAQVLTSLRITPSELKRKIDYYQEKEDLLRRESSLLLHSKRLLEEKLESMDRLARSLAHEIRNPVTAIGGLTQRLLRKGYTSNIDSEYLANILTGVRSLENIVSEVRAYADMPMPVLAQEDVGKLLASLGEEYRERARAASVELALEGQAGQAGQVLAWIDREQIRRLLEVLIDNALEAMPQGGRLALSLFGDDLRATIKVIDTGTGISSKDLPFLFDPLFSTKANAVGMNLAIAKRIATEHQGDLKVESTSARGTTFQLTLPLKQEAIRPDAQK